MSWHGIEGHDARSRDVPPALGRGRLASSFLFAGPAGIGKRTFALKLAQAMLCQQRPEAALDPCETCPSCTMALAGTHPDIEVVAKPADKAFLPLELLIGEREHRGQEGLCHNIGLKPFMGGRKIAIIDDADFLNAEGANCLLKTLEEPPPQSVLILIGTSPAKQLPTIRSRCQLVRFRPLEPEMVAELLRRAGPGRRRGRGPAAGPAQRRERRSGRWSWPIPELWAFRGTLYERLAAPTLDSVRLAPAVSAFVDEAGKEARPGAGGCGRWSVLPPTFIRASCEAAAAPPLPDDPELRRFVGAGGRSAGPAATRPPRSWIAVWRPWNRSIATRIRRRLIEAWLDALAAA